MTKEKHEIEILYKSKVEKSIENDIKDQNTSLSLNTCKDFQEIASYIGKLNIKHSSPDGVNTECL